MSFLKITTAELAQVPNFLGATQRQIARAGQRTVRKVASSAASQAAREIAAAHDLPVSLLRKRGQRWTRVHVKHEKRGLEAEGPVSIVWVGVKPIKAIYIGAARQRKDGVRVRGHVFPGAFINTMPSGHRGIFMRHGRARLPIDEQKVELGQAAGILRRLQGATPARLSAVFKQEMNYELNVRGR